MGDTTDTKPVPRESSFAKGFGIGMGIIWAFVLLNLIILIVVLGITWITGIPPSQWRTQQTVNVPLLNSPAVSLAGQPRWTHHGQNDLCVGRPKGVRFTCTPPGSTTSKTCVCE